MKKSLLTSFLLLFIIFQAIACAETPSEPGDENGDPNGSVENGDSDEDREWQLVWSDEFDTETLDLTKWSFQYGTGSDEGLTDWGNNELQYYTDREENLFIEDGKLHIVAQRESFEGKPYTSTRIRTKDKGDWVYGRIEVRAKMPEGQGIWPAIWMLPSAENSTWPRHGEIDIMELVGHEPETVHGTVHFGGDWPFHELEGQTYTLEDETFADDFHIFSIEWKLNEILFFVDGNHYFTVTPATVQQHGYNYPFNAAFHLLMNVAVGGNWPGNPDSTTEFPQTMVVDYVRVYQLE